jgi:hypothetical protein
MAHALTRHRSTPASRFPERDQIAARRNILLGLWAAGELGLTGEDAELYAWSVHFSDLGEPGHDDVVAKIADDFAAHGRSADRWAIRRRLHVMRSRAEADLAGPFRTGGRP